MAYGIEIFKPDGSSIFDSDSKAFGIYDVFYIERNTSGSKSYPELAGYTIDCNAVMTSNLEGIFGNAPRQFSISYSSGYPIVSWTYNPAYVAGSLNYAQMRVFIILKTAPAISTYGFIVKNEQNEVSSTDFTRNYQYIGDATLASHTDVNIYVDSRLEVTISCAEVPIVFVQNIEGQVASTTRIWWTGSVWRIRIMKSTNTIPRVLCFVPSSTAGTGYGLQVFSSSGAIEFDSTALLLSARSYANYIVPNTTYTGSGATVKLLSTSLLTTVGTIPSNSASFCPAQAFYGVESVTDYAWVKWAYAGIKKQSGAMYSGWVIETLFAYSYDTFFPILITSNLNRIYTIDASKY